MNASTTESTESDTRLVRDQDFGGYTVCEGQDLSAQYGWRQGGLASDVMRATTRHVMVVRA
ncbi:hypothetical protein ACJ51O_38430 (plasmid) [Burkholderia pyrrocinia]|uniref:hypothetical protein n=1 Tax=Burkholderia pyrrocinia TaxID=60550 RepID=UPI0038B56565